MRARVAAAAAASAALLLAGCAEQVEEPSSLPPVSPVASPTMPAAVPSPSLSGPKAPVEQAVLAYYTALNTAFSTGDLTAYSALHRPECQACKNVEELIRSTAAKGHRFEGVQNVVDTYTIPDFTGRNAVADVQFRVTPYRIVAADGSVVTESEGSQRRNLIVLNEIGGAWLVGEVNAG